MPIPGDPKGPEEWIALLSDCGCRAAYSPVDTDSCSSERTEYAAAAHEHDIVIAEVGAWVNIATPVDAVREAAVAHCIRCLELAEEIGARCCLTTAGSVHAGRGPHPENMSEQTRARIVASVRRILRAVRPVRTRFALEMMPWIPPNSPESYRRLLDEIDDPSFAAHMDPVNVILTHNDAYRNGELIRRCFTLLGGAIASCHAKDVAIGDGFPIELRETAPGHGLLHYRTYLAEIDAIDPDLPLMLEHLSTDAEYIAAAEFVRSQYALIGG